MASILMPFILLSYALFRNFFSCFIEDMYGLEALVDTNLVPLVSLLP